jgi:ABC-type Mn2+/Zn2+ transport system ATPase subunit
MDYSKPTLLIISGPNGAGKSTHIQTMLPDAFEGIFLLTGIRLVYLLN